MIVPLESVILPIVCLTPLSVSVAKKFSGVPQEYEAFGVGIVMVIVGAVLSMLMLLIVTFVLLPA